MGYLNKMNQFYGKNKYSILCHSGPYSGGTISHPKEPSGLLTKLAAIGLIFMSSPFG